MENFPSPFPPFFPSSKRREVLIFESENIGIVLSRQVGDYDPPLFSFPFDKRDPPEPRAVQADRESVYCSPPGSSFTTMGALLFLPPREAFLRRQSRSIFSYWDQPETASGVVPPSSSPLFSEDSERGSFISPHLRASRSLLPFCKRSSSYKKVGAPPP